MAAEGEAQLHQPHTRPAHSCLIGPPKSRTILPIAGIGAGRLLGSALCGVFFASSYSPPGPRASEKAPSENAWCFFALSDSHHVRRPRKRGE
jgi:hypothetical protein